MRPGRLALFYRSGGMWFVLGILWAACVFTAGLFAWALMQIDRVSEVSDTMFTIALLTSAMLAIIASSPLFWMCRRRRQALFRDLWPHRLAVCPTCWYPMMRGSGRCSECGRAITRYRQELCIVDDQAATLGCLIPSAKGTPAITSFRSVEPFNARQRFEALSINLNTIVRHATRLPLPLVLS